MIGEFSTNLGIKLGKIVTELRLKPNIDFYSNMVVVAKDVYDEHFEHWELQHTSAKLWNPKTGITLTIKHNSWSLICEFPDSAENYFNLANKIFPLLIKKMECKQIARFGLRFQSFVSSNMSTEEQVKLFHLQTHSSLVQNLNCFRDKVTDDAMVINTNDEDFKFHYQCGPVVQKELSSRLIIEQKKDQILKYPELAIWCDADCSITEVPSDRFEEILIKSFQKSVKNVDEILTYLCSREQNV